MGFFVHVISKILKKKRTLSQILMLLSTEISSDYFRILGLSTFEIAYSLVYEKFNTIY